MLKMAENSAEERRKRARVCEARSEKSAREREKAEIESKRAANEKKIERLKTARDSIQSQKNSAKAKRKKLEKYANGDEIGEWIGKEQTATVYSIEGNVVGQYNTYIERIDDVVDALIRAGNGRALEVPLVGGGRHAFDVDFHRKVFPRVHHRVLRQMRHAHDDRGGNDALRESVAKKQQQRHEHGRADRSFLHVRLPLPQMPTASAYYVLFYISLCRIATFLHHYAQFRKRFEISS